MYAMHPIRAILTLDLSAPRSGWQGQWLRERRHALLQLHGGFLFRHPHRSGAVKRPHPRTRHLCDCNNNPKIRVTREHLSCPDSCSCAQIFIVDIVINFRSAWFVVDADCLTSLDLPRPSPPNAHTQLHPHAHLHPSSTFIATNLVPLTRKNTYS